MKGILPPDRYNHFLKLHMAIRILASSSYLEKNEIAHDLLVEFVEEFGVINEIISFTRKLNNIIICLYLKKIYGPSQLIYNLHNLVHLAKECQINGPLDSWSAFVYESYLGRYL